MGRSLGCLQPLMSTLTIQATSEAVGAMNPIDVAFVEALHDRLQQGPLVGHCRQLVSAVGRAACQKDNKEALMWYARRGCDVDELATFAQHLVVKGHLDCLRTLQELGVNLLGDAVTAARGWQLSHFASQSGKLECLKYLHSLGMPMISFTHNGETPASLAASGGHFECLRFLAEIAGVNLHYSSKPGTSLLHLAAKCRHNSAMLSYLISYGIDVNALTSKTNSTAAIIAAEVGWADNLATLIDVGADLRLTNHCDDTPLHVACRSYSTECVKLLIASGRVDVNAPGGWSSFTPLLIAANDKHSEICILLLNAGGRATSSNRNEQLRERDAAKAAEFLKTLTKPS